MFATICTLFTFKHSIREQRVRYYFAIRRVSKNNAVYLDRYHSSSANFSLKFYIQVFRRTRDQNYVCKGREQSRCAHETHSTGAH